MIYFQSDLLPGILLLYSLHTHTNVIIYLRPPHKWAPGHEGEKGPVTLGNSAVCRHIRSKEHNPEELFFKILESEPDRGKREYKEAIAIRVMQPTLNEDEGKKYIPHIYDRLLKTTKYEAATPYKKFKKDFIKTCEEYNKK